jgi:hypothetical protein
VADGREFVEQAYVIVNDVAGSLEHLRDGYPEETFGEFEDYIGASIKWAKLCRNKVWLRSHEGTELARSCLDAANRLRGSLAQPALATEAGADLSSQLESLARLISTKAQIIT